MTREIEVTKLYCDGCGQEIIFDKSSGIPGVFSRMGRDLCPPCTINILSQLVDEHNVNLVTLNITIDEYQDTPAAKQVREPTYYV